MRHISSRIGLLGWIGLLMLGAGRGSAQDQAEAESRLVVATVGDEPIYAGDVKRLLEKATGGKEVNPAALPVLQAQVLSEIVDRRLVAA